jgi:c-di-GMP-binding flagellar brake protein YcgR
MSSEEKRKHKRIEARIDVQIELVLPEETFQPKRKGGRTLNICEQGMKIMMCDVSEHFYKKLLSPMRYAKINFSLPVSNKHKVLHGKIVWLDYNSQTHDCTFGVYFETITPEDQQEMRDFIQMLETQQSEIKVD